MSKMDKYLKHEEFYVLLLIFCFMLVETNINATTILMEAREDGDPLPVLMPFLLEYSSGLALLALVPLIFRFERRFPLVWSKFRQNFGWHVLASVIFSILHIALMLAMRLPVFRYFGWGYTFENPLWELLYEYRKDAWAYAFFLSIIYVYRFVVSRLAGEASLVAEGEGFNDAVPDRLLVKKLGKEFIVRVDDIEWLESSGNYVNLHIGKRIYPLRATLSALAEQLEPRGFRRIHRSHAVNLDFVASITPLESGDATVTLKNDQSLSMSRSYRNEFRQQLGI